MLVQKVGDGVNTRQEKWLQAADLCLPGTRSPFFRLLPYRPPVGSPIRHVVFRVGRISGHLVAVFLVRSRCAPHPTKPSLRTPALISTTPLTTSIAQYKQDESSGLPSASRTSTASSPSCSPVWLSSLSPSTAPRTHEAIRHGTDAALGRHRQHGTGWTRLSPPTDAAQS